MLGTRAFAIFPICILTLIGSTLAADPVEKSNPAEAAEEQRPSRPSFVVYAAPEDTELATSLFRVLRGKDKVTRLAKAESIEQALATEADVLVLAIPGRTPLKLEKETLEALKQRKIVGVGEGAARLFGQMGLQICDDACAHGISLPATINVTSSELLGPPKKTGPLPALRQPPEVDLDIKQFNILAMFIPQKSPDASVVDVIARWAKDPLYAPIVRQGNCVLIGLPVPTSLWTPEYVDIVNAVCLELRTRKLEPFAPARRELTGPGTYEFKLAKSRSTEELFAKVFYFRFAEPKKITARLEHAGSDSVMLIFMGEDESHMHLARKDARKGEPLEISATILQEQIEQLADRHWKLDVTNFDTKAPVDCKLTITCEAP